MQHQGLAKALRFGGGKGRGAFDSCGFCASSCLRSGRERLGAELSGKSGDRRWLPSCSTNAFGGLLRRARLPPTALKQDALWREALPVFLCRGVVSLSSESRSHSCRADRSSAFARRRRLKKNFLAMRASFLTASFRLWVRVQETEASSKKNSLPLSDPHPQIPQETAPVRMFPHCR